MELSEVKVESRGTSLPPNKARLAPIDHAEVLFSKSKMNCMDTGNNPEKPEIQSLDNKTP